MIRPIWNYATCKSINLIWLMNFRYRISSSLLTVLLGSAWALSSALFSLSSWWSLCSCSFCSLILSLLSFSLACTKLHLCMITLFLTYTFSALSTFSTGSVSSSSKSSSIRPSMAVSIWSVLLISSSTVMIAAASSPNCCFVPSYTFIVDIGHFLVQSWQHCFLIFRLVLSKGE